MTILRAIEAKHLFTVFLTTSALAAVISAALHVIKAISTSPTPRGVTLVSLHGFFLLKRKKFIFPTHPEREAIK